MITLIGEDIAEKGSVFIFYGSTELCENCRFKASCIDSLEKGRKYKIVDVKDTKQKCELHNGNVKVVEVEKANITSLIDSKKAFEGSTISYDYPNCDLECVFHEFCFPEGLYPEDKCTIIENTGKHDGNCDKGFSLNKVILKY